MPRPQQLLRAPAARAPDPAPLVPPPARLLKLTHARRALHLAVALIPAVAVREGPAERSPELPGVPVSGLVEQLPALLRRLDELELQPLVRARCPPPRERTRKGPPRRRALSFSTRCSVTVP